jgi:leucyl/phenylalanyl-tRNA--protein transferase
MFALMPNASKVALKFLVDTLIDNGFDFIDCQVETPHLVSLGARLIDRGDFLDQLGESLNRPSKIGSWSNWSM